MLPAWSVLAALVPSPRVLHPPRACVAPVGRQDPLRPDRPPIEPLVINAIQELLSAQAPDPAAVAERALAARSADPDYVLTGAEADRLRASVAAAAAAAEPLGALLQAAADAAPWVAKFGATQTFGLGELSDPYVRLCRAECMLAALVLHVEGGRVDFVDEERLEVLRDAPSEAVAALRKAAGGVR